MYPLPFFNPSSTDGCSGQALAKTAGANWRHIRAARFLQRKWRAKKRGEDISVSMADIAQMRIEQHRQEVQRMYASGNWASQKKQQDSNRAGAAKRRQLAEAQAKREKAEAERLEREARERQEAAEAEAEYALTAAAQNIAEGAPKAMHDPNFILVDKLQTPEMAEAAAEHPRGALGGDPEHPLTMALQLLEGMNVVVELARRKMQFMGGDGGGGLDSDRSSHSSGSSNSSRRSTPRPRPAGPSPRQAAAAVAAAAAAAAPAAAAVAGGDAAEAKKGSPRPRPPGLPPSRSNSAKAEAKDGGEGDGGGGGGDEKK